MDVDVEVQLFGLSSYYAAVVMEILSLTTVAAAAVMTTAVYGLSFFFSSAVADVVVETDSANPGLQISDGLFRRFLFSFFTHLYFFL